MLRHLRTVLVLGRMSNLATVWTNVLAAWFLAGGDWSGALWWMMAGVSLLYVGGMTLNDAFDVKWDQQHAPERPVPAGLISERAVWVLGWGQMVAGGVMIVMLTAALWYYLVALVAVIVIYDWSHKRWKGAVLAMGACRFMVYVVAASAAMGVGGRPSLQVCLFAGGLFAYIVGISLAARGESVGGGASWLAKLLLGAPLLIGLLVKVIAGGEDSVFLALAVFALWLVYAFWQLRSPRADRIGKFVSALLAGIILVDLIVLVIDSFFRLVRSFG
ncbi:MAG: UbiA family prenyltransferase [Verrucomicrobiales bacterium]|nr:UbiA family prenyltransferase [Verrucomicrobiales bacterium]